MSLIIGHFLMKESNLIRGEPRMENHNLFTMSIKIDAIFTKRTSEMVKVIHIPLSSPSTFEIMNDNHFNCARRDILFIQKKIVEKHN